MHLDNLSIATVFQAHMLSARRVSLDVEWLDKTFTIIGRGETVIDYHFPIMQILTDDSTPENSQICRGADEAFKEHVRLLMEEGRSFYTVLKTSWSWPALDWRIQE